MQEIAYTDKLTKMGNRYALERDARECVLEQTSIVSMDLNLLKTTNDTYGHAGGDVLLQSAAKCMTAVYDKVYRVGGDEFIALNGACTRIHRSSNCFLPSACSADRCIWHRIRSACC